MVSTLGWVLGGGLIGEIGIGAVTGILQWIVLRRQVRQAGWWVLASTAGWAGGWAVVIAMIPPEVGVLAGAVVGATMGAMQ